MAKRRNRQRRKSVGRNAITRFRVTDVKKRDALIASILGGDPKGRAETADSGSVTKAKGRLGAVILEQTGERLDLQSHVAKDRRKELLSVGFGPDRDDVTENIATVKAILVEKARIEKSVRIAREAVRRELE